MKHGGFNELHIGEMRREGDEVMRRGSGAFFHLAITSSVLQLLIYLRYTAPCLLQSPSATASSVAAISSCANIYLSCVLFLMLRLSL